ncbi:MAG: hypothetical protein IIT33_08750, partial [Prevotella sp.]|nr:hypothetical protein [Prevotella sp.]
TLTPGKSILASCTTSFSVYVSLSKNSFLCAPKGLALKADAKVRLFFESPKLFEKNFRFSLKK